MKDEIESFLNEVGKKEKYWSFNVKFENDEPNWAVFNEFKEFCKNETSKNYLAGIKKLMDYYKADFKYASLFGLIDGMKAEMLDFSTKITSEVEKLKEKPKEQKKGVPTFGG